MSRRTVNGILIAHLALVWCAFVFRIDRFPLTWAPMYSTYSHSTKVTRRVESQETARRGFHVKHRDETWSYVGAKELNISKWIMGRLYYQRAFGKGPIKHKQGNQNLGVLNRWVRGLGPEEDRFDVDWEPRLFETVNKTLGYAPDDAKFIVRIRAFEERISYDPESLEVLGRKKRKARLRWNDEWRDLWADEPH